MAGYKRNTIEDYQDMTKDPSAFKLVSEKISPLGLKKIKKRVLGMTSSQLVVVVVILVVSLMLYSVLLHLTVRAAQCQDTMETIMQQRREWQRKVMEGVNRSKRS
eukprot:GFUD01011219.1.p1 GENE.GFUD01011219.1~~GFUD01011219.1.p1  ORF type:complete len:105 (-),score=50.49 GFUD01011219.1:476-790(-)